MYWNNDRQGVNFLETEIIYSASTNYLNGCLLKYYKINYNKFAQPKIFIS